MFSPGRWLDRRFFTIFDIARVFVKVTLIKSRSRSLGRNNNFFLSPFSLLGSTLHGKSKKNIAGGSWEGAHGPCSFARKRSVAMEINGNHFIYRETLPAILAGRNPPPPPSVVRMDCINIQFTVLLVRATVRQCAVRDACNRNYARLHCYKYPGHTR